MAGEKKGKQRIRWPLRLVLTVALVGAFVFHLPSVLRWSVNRLWPVYRSISNLPVSGGRVTSITTKQLQADGFVLDAGSGMQIHVDDVIVEYSLSDLLDQKVQCITGALSGGGRLALAGNFSVQDLERDGNGFSGNGSVRISQAAVGSVQAGPFEMSGRLNGSNAVFSAEVPLLDQLLMATVRVDVQWASNVMWRVSAVIPFSAPDRTPVALGAIYSALNGAVAHGQVSVDLSGEGSQGVATIAAEFSHVEFPERALRIDHLKAHCVLKIPGDLRSFPEQSLSVERVTVGGIRLENVQADYQLEPDGVLFIERLDADWCGGRIRLAAARFGAERPEVSLKLLCDRLSLEQVLNAFGQDRVSVGGELNGSLPVRLTGRRIAVDDGFLFTTPGRTGTLAFRTPGMVEHLLPAQSLQAGQLGFISAALTKFEYNWITMTLNTEDDDLRVAVELSGQPADVLPYEYDPRRQMYVAVPAGSGRGTRQPMHFTFNLTVPLNRLIWYTSQTQRTLDIIRQH